MSDTLYIVVPCYNEEAVLPETARRLGEKLTGLTAAGKISDKSRVLFVNDGSKDGTWSIISGLHQSDSRFSGVDLSRNRGHQNALLAGLMTAKDRADMVISMDADLQDDIDAVDAMVDKFHEGCDIVYGVRSAREKDTFFKRVTAEGFYRFMSFLGAETVFNHADYRLMSRRALEGLEQFREVNLFLRGIVPMIGYTTGYVSYERGGAIRRREQVPPQKDALLRPGGHHQPLHQAHPVHHPAGLPGLSGEHRHAHLLRRPLGHGGHHPGLGQPHLLGVGHRRAHPAVPGGHRGVYRQDLPGDQGPAPVPDPGGIGGAG